MNDNEILKALDLCSESDWEQCKICPYRSQGTCCRQTLQKDVLNLLNRQKAEIERLQDYNANLLTANTALSNEILEAKSETIKEFADRLKRNFCILADGHKTVDTITIDNLVKEMLEGKE